MRLLVAEASMIIPHESETWKIGALKQKLDCLDRRI